MYKVDLPLDQSIKKAVERRRSAERARKAQIFNTQLRVMGLDVDALNKQVEEKKHRQNMEMQQDKAFDNVIKYHDNLLLQQDIDERNKSAALNADLTQYWSTDQRVEDSQGADLKCGLKGAFRIAVPEGELGPARMQSFQGEEIKQGQKRREQMKKTERDLCEQKEDNERRRMEEKHREMCVSKELVLQDLKGVRLFALEEESKKAARIALDNYNLAMAAQLAEKLKEQHRREERENLAEILHSLTSDMMTENAEATQIELGGGRPGRVLINRWKGMSPEQLSAIHKEREEQHLKRQRQRDAEKAQDVAWELQLLELSRKAEEEKKKEEALRREKRIQTDRYNKQLAREQRADQEYLNKKLYTNKPTKDYFNQFNTSSR